MKPCLRLLLPLLAALLLPCAARADSTSLLAQAQAAKPTRYAFAISKGAELRNTSDNRSYTAWWAPAGTPKGVIVALHGHDSWALDELYLWQPYAEREGYAVLALQWWFGSGEATSDYYTPDEMYPLLSARLAEKGVKPGSAMFLGYSRGAANTYALAALDTTGPVARRWFGFVFANAGGAMLGYPPTSDVDRGKYGTAPYAGVPWGMYCGELDPDPTQSGCPAMSFSRDWVTRLGGAVVLYIDDPSGDHGGFMTRPANVESALATYAQVLAGTYAMPACTLSSSPASVRPGTSVTLTAACTPAAATYRWTGGSCMGTTGARCTTSPQATTTYSAAGSNSIGWGVATTATVTVMPDAVVSGAEAECLFNWGEDSYAAQLAPRRSATLTWSVYTYRAYATTGTYLGISSADWRLYFIDASGRTSDLGPAATWSAQARCR